MRSLTLPFTVAFLTAISVVTARAQEPAAPPSHIAYVEGQATIDHEGESEPAAMNMPVAEGDRIRTQNGRVTVLFPDGSGIDIDPFSDVEFLTTTRVRVIAGAIEHRAAAVDPRSPSAQNLPPDLQTYGPDLDQSGAWQYESQYGNVWYPTVAADWRPYYNGYWESVPAYGWTWISYDRWGWPTHHYGRWGYARNRWFWIPGRTWAAAWVSWSTAPDYVSWCPLGYDGRAIVSWSVGYRSSWNPWVVVRRDHFGRRDFPANRYRVEPYRIASTTPFIEHRFPPAQTRGRVSVAPSLDGSRRASGVQIAPSHDGSRRGSTAPVAPSLDGSRRSAGQSAPAWSGSSGRDVSPSQRGPATGVAVPRYRDDPAYAPQYRPNYESQPTPRYRRDRTESAAPAPQPPASQPPTYQAPTHQAPAYQAPVYQAPTYRAPTYQDRAERRAQPRESVPPRAERQPEARQAPPPGNSRAGSGGAQAPRQENRGGDRSGESHGRARSDGAQTTGTAVRRQPR